MLRGVLLFVGAVTLVAGILLAIGFASFPHEIRRPADYLQTEFQKHLPKTTHGVTAQKATVEIKDGRVVVLAEITGTRLLKSFSMVVKATGTPDFQHRRNGELYFLPEDITVLDFDDGNPTALKWVPTRIKDKVEGWMAHSAEIGAKLALEHVPVYRLKDDKVGWVLNSSIEDVRVDGNDIVVTYSVWALTKVVLVALLIVFVAICLLAVLIVCPEVLLCLLEGLEIFSIFT